MHNEHILVVEDEAALRDTIIEAMEFVGFKVTACENGLEALMKTVNLQPDLVICDVNMPVMSGFDYMKRIKEVLSDPPPVIMLTAHVQVKDRTQGLRLGASEYLAKPFDTRQMLDVVAERLKRKKAWAPRLAEHAEHHSRKIAGVQDEEPIVFNLSQVIYLQGIGDTVKVKLKRGRETVINSNLEEFTFLLEDNFTRWNDLIILHSAIDEMTESDLVLKDETAFSTEESTA